MFALTNSAADILQAVSSAWNEFPTLFSLVQFFYLPGVKSTILPSLDCFDLLGWHNIWCLHLICDDCHSKAASQCCIVYVKVAQRVDLRSSYPEGKKKTVPECQVFRSCVIWFPLLSLSSARPHTPWTGWLWERAGLFHPLLCCHRLPLSLAWLAHTHSLGFSDSSSEKFSLISQYSDGCPPYMFLSLSFFWPRGLQDLTSLTRDWTPGPQQWNCTELTTGPPGKSPSLHVSTASSLSCPAVPTLDGKCLLKCLPLWLSCELSKAWSFVPGCTSSAQHSDTNTVGAEYSLVKWQWMKALRVSIFRPGVTGITSEPSWFTGRSLTKLAFHCSSKTGLLQTISLLFQKSPMGQRPRDESSVHRFSLDKPWGVIVTHFQWKIIKISWCENCHRV